MDARDFSQFVCNWGSEPPTPADLIDVAKHAEELGFYSIQIPHVPILPYAEERPPRGGIASFIPDQYRHFQYDALSLVPVVLHATSRIKVGFNILVTPWLHPFVYAKYLASLDAMSGGRLIAGFGLGSAGSNGRVKALENIGIDGTKRGKMSDESLDIMTRLWTETAPISFNGFTRGIDLVVDPKPAQKPYPELWWAGEAPAAIERAARYCDFLEVNWQSAKRVKEHYAPALRDANARLAGHARLADFVFSQVLSSDPSREELDTQYHSGWLEDAIAVGVPDTVAEILSRLHESGVDHFALDMHRHGWEHVRVVHNQMDAFASKVLPLLKRSKRSGEASRSGN